MRVEKVKVKRRQAKNVSVFTCTIAVQNLFSYCVSSVLKSHLLLAAGGY